MSSSRSAQSWLDTFNEEDTVAKNAPNEPITLIGLDEARARGAQVRVNGEEAPNELESHPHCREVELQGSEAESAAARSMAERVAKAIASLVLARTKRLQFDPLYQQAAEQWVAAEQEVKRTEDELDTQRRLLPLLPFGSGAVFLILLVIAAAEFVLNRTAFEITGEDSLNIDVLALAVGVGLVTAAHYLGIGLRRLVDRLPGTPLSPAALLISSLGGALLMAILSLHSLREAFFAESEVPVPGGALAWLQAFLLWVAVALSAAHAHPLRQNLTRVRAQAAARRKAFEKARGEWTSLFDKHTAAHAKTWAAVAAAAADADIQAAHTERARQAFAQGANGTLAPSTNPDNRLPRSWYKWLEANQVDLATPQVVADVERLIGSLREANRPSIVGDANQEDDASNPSDEVPQDDADGPSGPSNDEFRIDLDDLQQELNNVEVTR